MKKPQISLFYALQYLIFAMFINNPYTIINILINYCILSFCIIVHKYYVLCLSKMKKIKIRSMILLPNSIDENVAPSTKNIIHLPNLNPNR